MTENSSITPAVRGDKEAGITLLEILVVLLIVALLAALVAPNVIRYLGQSRSQVAEAQMASIATALELYYIDMGRYPGEEDGLIVLVEAPENDPVWQGPYFREASGLTDPWGRPYLYELGETGDQFTIRTLGSDGEEGGEGDNADLSRS
ncbi:type II secretion system major pseudopilin GspG [Maricaulis sp.]|uniref:type II secretion system major pseudopilin GspG n=1 Tax=Maricaulis sp. TaxID=1486257 RepID=UPI002612FE60|nr:type II secretion system major pseudopilin GspG [Maricaulis sp.]